MFKKIVFTFAITVIVIAKGTAQQSISEETLYKHLSFLSSDKLEGRFPGTK